MSRVREKPRSGFAFSGDLEKDACAIYREIIVPDVLSQNEKESLLRLFHKQVVASGSGNPLPAVYAYIERLAEYPDGLASEEAFKVISLFETVRIYERVGFCVTDEMHARLGGWFRELWRRNRCCMGMALPDLRRDPERAWWEEMLGKTERAENRR